VSDISETLREQKGHQQVAEEKDAHDEPDDVVRAHSRSTALRIRNAMRKKRAVNPR
jgi:hypothetical protein